jgi:hypothetical protein
VQPPVGRVIGKAILGKLREEYNLELAEYYLLVVGHRPKSSKGFGTSKSRDNY